MKKNINFKLFLVVFWIMLVLINVLVFAIFKPGNIESDLAKQGFWISYGFMTVAFLFQVLSFFMIGPKKGMNAIFFGIPLFTLAVSYFLIQSFISVVFMILTSFNVEVPLLLVIVFQFVFFALFLIAFLVTLMTKNFITSRDELIKKNVYQIRSLTSDVDIAIEMSDDRELKDLLKTLTEDIRYSDPMSIKEIESIEEEIKDRVTQIQSYVRQGNKDQVIALVKETKLMLKQRNSIIANKKS